MADGEGLDEMGVGYVRIKLEQMDFVASYKCYRIEEKPNLYGIA